MAGVDIDVAGANFDVAGANFDIAGEDFDVAGPDFDKAGAHLDVTGGNFDVPGPEIGVIGLNSSMLVIVIGKDMIEVFDGSHTSVMGSAVSKFSAETSVSKESGADLDIYTIYRAN